MAMEKITKKAFIATMTSNEIIFGGVTGGGMQTVENLEKYMEKMNSWKNNTSFDTRRYTARNRDLISDEGSVLDLAQHGKYTYYKLENQNGKILIVDFETDSAAYGKIKKDMYYYIAA